MPYWIVNPLKRTVLVYDFEQEKRTNQYSFDDSIPACIFEEFNITLADLLLRQEGEPLRCYMDETVGSWAEPGSYQLFLQATEGDLEKVKGSVLITSED